MAFYLAGSTQPNPTLAVERGERVRVVLVNRDGGYRHDFAVASLEVATPTVAGDGSFAEVTFRAPQAPGDHPYVCSSHAAMMGATLRVR